MNKITWVNFDGDRFQRFCNAFLYSHISPKAHLYSAPGPDGGIDQYYIGDYHGYSGKWRFQDKFKSTSRATAVASLKQDIPQDINDHAVDEDVIVYLTNVNLTPKNERELHNLANQTLLRKGITANITILFWHQATLDAIIDTDPVLYNRFFATGVPLLEYYRDYFSRQLHAAGLGYQLSNPFVGRQTDLELLTRFLSGPASMLAVTADGFYGKTRLILQFFQQVVDLSDEWLALVLKPEGFSAASFAQMTAGSRKLLLLIDDARRHTDILGAVKTEIDKTRGRVKVILTTRKNSFLALKSTLPTHAGDIQELPLTVLGPIETKELCKMLLPWETENNLHWLRERSAGIPGLIVVLCDMVRHSRHPLDAAARPEFAEKINEMIREAIDSVTAITDQPPILIRKFIHLVALVGPAHPQDTPELAALLECSEEDLQAIIRTLCQPGSLVTVTPSIAVKPDPVSDSILRGILISNPAWVKRIAFHPRAHDFIGNILDNLADLDVPTEDETRFVGELLSDYIDNMTGLTITEEDIRRILHTANILSFRNPALAVKALYRFLELDADSDHPLQQIKHFATHSAITSLRNDAGLLLARLVRDANDEGALNGYFPLFERYTRQLEDPKLLYPCFGFSQFDFEASRPRSASCCFRQLFLAGRIKDYFISDDLHQTRLALAAFKCYTQHSFTYQEPLDKYTGEFIHGNFMIPDCPHVRELRRQVFEGIIAYRKKQRRHTPDANLTLDDIADALRFMFFNPGNPPIIDSTGELEMVVAYLKDLLNSDPTADEKAVIVDNLNKLQRNGCKPEYEDDLRELRVLLEPDVATEKLELFLQTADFRTEDHEARLRHVAESFPDISQFMEVLKAAIRGRPLPKKTMPLHDIAQFLGQYHLDQGRALLQFLIAEAPGVLPYLLSLMAFLIDEKDEFFSIIDRIWALGGADHKSIVIGILLGYRRLHENKIDRRDLDYFAVAIEDLENIMLYSLEYKLHLYADLDPDRTFLLLPKLALKAGANPAGSIIMSICEDQAFQERHKDRIFSFLKDIAGQVDVLRPDFRPGLFFIRNHFGDDQLFFFLTDTLRAKSESMFYYPHDPRLAWDGPYADACALHLRFLTWLPSYTAPLKEYLHDILLRYFLPRLPVTDPEADEFKRHYLSRIDAAPDPSTLDQLAFTLHGYHPYTTAVLETLCQLVEKYNTLTSNVRSAKDLVGTHFVDNKTPRSGVPGFPYTEDMHKAAFLKEFITSRSLSGSVRPVLEQALSTVEQAIAEQTRGDLWE